MSSRFQHIADRMRSEIVSESIELLRALPQKPIPKRKLLVARTVAHGRQILEAFMLDPEEWHVSYLTEGLQGRQFDRIVVDLPDQIDVHTKNEMQHLPTRLSRDGQIYFL